VAFLSELPLATTNKIDRKALRQMAHERWSASEQLSSRGDPGKTP
jgi:acyl-coenzyme A synthetase/AMP-(fatty) acid ligase